MEQTQESSNNSTPKYITVNGAVKIFDSKSNKYRHLCREIDIVTAKRNIITSNITIELSCTYKGQKSTFEVGRETFAKSKIVEVLAQKGMDVNEGNSLGILNYLYWKEKEVECKNIHDRLGWTKIGNKEFFLGYKVNQNGIESVYNGDMDIAPRGSYEQWKKVIDENVIGSKYLELALVLGFSSVVAAKLKSLIGLDVLFFHIYGKSTTGKTTALMVAASPFGRPCKDRNGMIRTWLATDNAIIAYLKDKNGIPMLLDEASSRKNKDYTSMIYQIADGSNKGRADKNGNLRENKVFSGTVLSTAENSILAYSNHNNGLRVRLIELAQLPWTESAEQAEILKSELSQNYGVASDRFIEGIINYSDEKWIKAFEKSKKKVKQMMTMQDDFSSRTADKIAVIWLTAILVKRILELDIDVDEVVKVLIDADAEQVQDRNMEQKAYECILSEVRKNHHKFAVEDKILKNDNDIEMPKGEYWGKIIMRKDKLHEILIKKEDLQKILSENQFTDINTILSTWRDKGVIDVDKGKSESKFTRKRVLFPRGKAERVIVIKADKEYDQYQVES